MHIDDFTTFFSDVHSDAKKYKKMSEKKTKKAKSYEWMSECMQRFWCDYLINGYYLRMFLMCI